MCARDRAAGPQLSRRSLLRGGGTILATGAALGGVAGIGSLVAAALDGRSGPVDELRIGYLPLTDAAPMLVAHGDGIYAERGLTVARPVLFRSWAALMEAFLTRQVDVVHLLMPSAIQLRHALGADAAVLQWNHTGGGALTVAPEVTNLGQLAGTRVAIPGWWSIHNILLQRLLRSAGLTPVVRTAPSRSRNTVELVVMGPSDMIPALAGGAIGGFAVADPFNTVAAAKGVGRTHVLLDDVWRDHACCVLLAHRDLVDERPGTAQALVDAGVDAQLRIRGDRAAAAVTLADGYLPQARPAISTAMTGTVPSGEGGGDRHRIGFSPFPFPSFTAELAHRMRDTLVDGDTRFLDDLDPDRVHADLVDDRFVRSAITRAGGPEVFGLPHSLTRTERLLP